MKKEQDRRQDEKVKKKPLKYFKFKKENQKYKPSTFELKIQV